MSTDPPAPAGTPSESDANRSALVEGVVVAVDGASFEDVTGFTLRDATGEELDFDVSRLEDPEAFPPVHLHAHLADAYPVVVRYVEEDGRRFALQLDDGKPPDPTG